MLITMLCIAGAGIGLVACAGLGMVLLDVIKTVIKR